MSARDASAAPAERILPDGCTEWVIHLGDRFLVENTVGRWTEQPCAFLVGPSDKALRIKPGRRVDTVGVRFRPGALARFLRVPLHSLSGRTPALDDLLGSSAASLVAALAEDRDAASRVRRLDAFVARIAAHHAPPLAGVGAAVEAALASRGAATVDALATACGLGRRQLERRFLEEVGLPPKVLLRLIRFQSVFQALGRDPDAAWVHLALDCGYTDQAHLVREFRDFSGEPPSRTLLEQGPLSRRFTSPERLRALLGE
jgi:AraC-like DNA-binding protein